MKDNYPNYLNPHNIDPSRIEPARIDTPPGNDSVRPGKSKKPTLQIAEIEEARATYRRLCEELGCYDAIRNSPKFYDVVRVAIGHLMNPPQSPWVRTADRLPTEADAGVDEEIVTIYDDEETRVMGTDYWAYVAKVPERFPYWLPVPKLPEVEE